MTTFIGFDIESSGVDPYTDRIVTFSIVAEGEPQPQEWLINPGVEIPEGAANVHGITTDMAVANGADPKQALTQIWEALRQATVDYPNVVFTAYNCPFDLTMLRTELHRHRVLPEGSTDLEDLISKHGIMDPLVIDKAVAKYRKGSRKLIDVASHYGFSLTNAHNATADVEATIFLARTFFNKFSAKASISDLMELQQSSKLEQAESLSLYFQRQGRDDWEVDGTWPILQPPR